VSLVFHRPQSAGELLDVSLNVVKGNGTLLLGLGIWLLVGLAMIDLGSRLLPHDSGFQSLTIPLTIGLYSVAEARISVAAWMLLHREPVDPAQVRAMVRGRLGSIVVSYALKWFCILLGLVLIVPGVLLTLRWFAVPVANVIEGLGVRQGFRRSRVLAQGNRRLILLTIGLLDVGLTIGSIVFAMNFMDPRAEHQPLWLSAAGWVFTLVYLPYHGVLSSALYANARLRNEGYDLEERLLSSVGAA
jgi:hypothetical protein